MIKAVLFDLDGTLIDTNRLIIESFKYTYKKHLNIDVGEEEICKYFGEAVITTLRRYDEKNSEDLLKTYRDYNEKMHDEMTKTIEGAEEIVRGLKKFGIKVGVVTSKRKLMAERGLKLANLSGIMDVLVTPEETEKHKPDPEPIFKACEFLGVEPSEILYVGDSHIDIMCSNNAGAKSCLVKYTALSVEEILKYNPSYTVDLLMEIIKIINLENKTSFTI